MAGKTVSFNSNCDLLESKFECLAKWLSCNGEIWGVGPTLVFASAAALFLYRELESTVFMPGDAVHVTMLEKSLVSTMVLGMLSLMIHLWVCSMRFFQYYLDTLIKDSPNFFLEMTTAGLLGSQAEIVPLGPLTRFLRQQQPQIHITICWFLSLCYADYVRKHYCQRFNLPYLEHWQAELQERASRKVNVTMAKVNSYVGAIHQRLRGFVPTTPPRASSEPHTVRARHPEVLSAVTPAESHGGAGEGLGVTPSCPKMQVVSRSACGSSVSLARRLQMRLKNFEIISPKQDVRAVVHTSLASATLSTHVPRTQRSVESFHWRSMATRPNRPTGPMD